METEKLTIPIRTDVPADMHPDCLLVERRALDVEGTIGAVALAAARDSLAVAYKACGDLCDAEAALRAASPAHRTGRRAVVDSEELFKAAGRALEATTQKMQRRYEELGRCRASLAGRVDAALDHPARRTPEGLAIATGVWAHVKSLSAAARLAFVEAAIKADDKTTVAAVLHAPAYLSGITGEHMSRLRDSAAKRFAPEDSAQLAAVDGAMGRLRYAGSVVIERFGRVLARRDGAAGRAADALGALVGGGNS
jgi:hypothetical protein